MDFVDANADVVTFGDNSFFELNDFSISFWVERDAIGDTHGLVSLQQQASAGGTQTGVIVRFDSTNHLEVLTSISNSFNTIETDEQFTDTSSWQYFTVTKTGTTLKIYNNGKELKSGTLPGSTVDYTNGSSKRTAIGGYWTSASSEYVFTPEGSIDEVAIFNYALSADEISVLYNNGTVSFD